MRLLPNAERIAREILDSIDVKVGGSRPFDIQVYDPRFYSRVLSHGTLGLGEAYMDGWWDAGSLDVFFDHALSQRAGEKIRKRWPMLALSFFSAILNRQSGRRAFRIGERHYDLGNDLYRAMLDRRMTYTCGYWKDASTLEEAQESKLELVCRKIGLKPGQKVLDIGVGWGSFAKYAAEMHGAEVVGMTVSKEQVALGRELCAGLPVTFVLDDYRKATGTYDHVVSLGMFEHVGPKNYRTFFETVKRVLKPDGLFLLHTIGSSESMVSIDPWMDKYIFPGAVLPSVAQMAKAIEGLFVMEDWHNFGQDYDKTLMAWHAHFESNWPSLKGNYDERFRRMWRYYLLSCAATFRSRMNQLWQVVYSPSGVRGGYRPVR